MAETDRDRGRPALVRSPLRAVAARAGRLLLRVVVPLTLLAGGVAALVYGGVYHAAAVSVEQEIEIDLAPPPGVEPPGFGMPGEGFPPAEPGVDDPALASPPPWLAPPPELTKVKQKVIVTDDVPEWALIREVTFGGVTRLSSGVLWRTYTGDPPSLCPT